MKVLMMVGMASAIAIAAAAPADARQGCGRGFHRAPNGVCVANRGGMQVYAVGRYYPGHGYWYNNQWYPRRYRYGHGWRYR